ncbi:hypothetical protein HAX54_029972, partial [Datura stramonium]|nr:hypothetical protein [Datura stramonium]
MVCFGLFEDDEGGDGKEMAVAALLIFGRKEKRDEEGAVVFGLERTEGLVVFERVW